MTKSSKIMPKIWSISACLLLAVVTGLVFAALAHLLFLFLPMDIDLVVHLLEVFVGDVPKAVSAILERWGIVSLNQLRLEWAAFWLCFLITILFWYKITDR